MAIGVDIEDTSRFESKSQSFLDRIYTQSEQEYCLAKKFPAKHLAVRFCAKEAVIKALSGLGLEHPHYKQIEIYHNENHVPQVRLLNKIDNKLTFQVSLSHDRSKAIAFVTIEKQC